MIEHVLDEKVAQHIQGLTRATIIIISYLKNATRPMNQQFVWLNLCVNGLRITASYPITNLENVNEVYTP